MTDDARPDDADLKALLRASVHDEAAFSQFVGRLEGRVWNTAWVLLRHRQDVEDVVQLTFLKVFRKRREYQDRGSVTAWVCTIARHSAMDVLRRKPQAVKQSDGDGGQLANMPDPKSLAKPDPPILLDAIDRWSGELTPAQQQVLVRRLAGLTNEEIGKELGMSPETVSKHFSDAKKRLLVLMQAEQVGRPDPFRRPDAE